MCTSPCYNTFIMRVSFPCLLGYLKSCVSNTLVSCMDKSWVDVVPCYLGPAVIKLFESENELKCKNRLRDFIETLCLFSNIWENSLRLFAISDSRYNYLAKFLLFSRKSYDKFLENILKFLWRWPWIVPSNSISWNHACISLKPCTSNSPADFHLACTCDISLHAPTFILFFFCAPHTGHHLKKLYSLDYTDVEQ